MAEGPTTIVLAGHSGAGKSTLARALAKRYEATLCEVGAFVRRRFLARCPNSRLVEFADSEFSDNGPETFIAEAVSSIDDDLHAVIAGIRRTEEYRFIKQLRPRAVMIWIDSSSTQREARLSSQSDFDLNYMELRDTLEISWGLFKLRELADLILDSSYSPEKLLGAACQWIDQK